MESSTAAAPPELISTTTILSLLLVVMILFAAYAVSVFHLPERTTTKIRVIYIWHIFDCLIHLIMEGSFLYYSFTSFSTTPTSSVATNRGSGVVATLQNPTLWGDPKVAYGAKFATAPLGQLWQEYARADIRWGEADVTVVTLELLTVIVGGPLAGWICVMLARGEKRAWFWITVLAVAELYGGWMTFGPEWISGSRNLVTDNWMYKWLYLFFFNTIWVWIPLWLLYEAYWQFVPALELADMVNRVGSTMGNLGASTFDYGDSDDSEEEQGKKER